jgi:energy-coupling factor transporter ATP-binding protein EcfA2
MAWLDTWLGTSSLLSDESLSGPVNNSAGAPGFCMASWDITSEDPVLDILNCWSPVGGHVSNSLCLRRNIVKEAECKPKLDAETEQLATEPKLDAEPEQLATEPKLDAEPEKADIEKIDTSTELVMPNCLLTGPNGSGKSTFLKSIMSAVIMAQTLGIVPASECKITPFTYLSTYLNIPDCQGKESLFQAEMRRCHTHLAKLKALEQAGKFSFNIMDEIFVSTNYKEGVSGAYAVIKALAKCSHSLNIITTHFDKLTTCELPTFSYKQFTVELSDNDTLNRDYKLKPGVCTQHMAIQLLRLRGFDPELIENAKTMLTQLDNTTACS